MSAEGRIGGEALIGSCHWDWVFSLLFVHIAEGNSAL